MLFHQRTPKPRNVMNQKADIGNRHWLGSAKSVRMQ